MGARQVQGQSDREARLMAAIGSDPCISPPTLYRIVLGWRRISPLATHRLNVTLERLIVAGVVEFVPAPDPAFFWPGFRLAPTVARRTQA